MLTNRSTEHSAFRVLARPNRALVFVVITTMAGILRPTVRVMFWGALGMALTTAIGALFGTVV